MMNPVVHFEMPAEDTKRIVKFYEKVFGWKTQQMGPEMGDYVVVTTTEIDEKTKFPKEPGRINGGFYKKTKDPLSHHPSIVIAVDDIREAMKKVEKAGGKVVGGGNKEVFIPGQSHGPEACPRFARASPESYAAGYSF